MQQAEERALAAVDELMQEKQQNREELTVVGGRGMRAEERVVEGGHMVAGCTPPLLHLPTLPPI